MIDEVNIDLQSTLEDFEVAVDVMHWYEECCQAFFDNLHHRWPVIHFTSFSKTTEPLVLVAIVVLLGHQAQKTAESAASDTYRKIVNLLSKDLVSLALVLIIFSY